MRALFIWPAPPQEPEHYVAMPHDVLATFDRVAAVLYPNPFGMTPEQERTAECEILGVVLDQFDARRPPEPSSPPQQPSIVVEGEACGVRWGYAEAPERAQEVRLEIFEPMDPSPAGNFRVPPATMVFRRHAFTDGIGHYEAFITEDLQNDQVAHVFRSGAGRYQRA